MTGGAARCSMKRCRSSPLPGPAGACTTTASTTTVDGIQFLPRPVRQTVPVWVAGFPGKVRPLRRAARYHGFFPVNLEHPDQLAEIAATITGLRQHATAPYDIAIALPPGTDPAPYAKAGATWWLAEFEPEAVSLDQVRGVLRDGPAVP